MLYASSSRLVTESRDILSLVSLGSLQAAREAMEIGFGDGLGSSADPSVVPVVSAPAPRPPGSGGFIPAQFNMSFVRYRLAAHRWLQADPSQGCLGSTQNTNSCVFDCTCSLTNRQKLYHLQQVQIIRETNDISTYVAGNFSFRWQRLSLAIVRPEVSQLFPFFSLI